MYATVFWTIDPSSTSSVKIKAAVDAAFGNLMSTPLRANVRIARLEASSDLNVLGRRFEAIHAQFPVDFDYVCVGSDGGLPLAPANRPTWDAAAVAAIIKVDD